MEKQEVEIAYEIGNKMAWLRILREALEHLGSDSPEWTAHRWLLERETTIIMLRRLCSKYGDNDWPDDLHLADVIEKHLEYYLNNFVNNH